ncbi:MAG: transketolase [Kiritimatiellae bacterium]|nr:transketolase [Kiritimatiellia bacterium]
MATTKDLLAEEIAERARRMRKQSIRMSILAGNNGAHLGPGFSMCEITATLYFAVMNHDPANPTWPDRDRFILSKGHGVLGYYTALAEAGYFGPDVLDTFESDESPLAGHPCKDVSLGVETSTGSLGHGLSIGVGLALGARMDGKSYDTYVLLGDGECNEGMVWEAVMTASQYKLDNLIAIVDRNRLQSDGLSREIIDMEPLAEKWRCFGWHVREVDGHDVRELLEAFHSKSRPKGRPYVVIAHTIKGKGVSAFEDNNAWHHNRISPDVAATALQELGFEMEAKEVQTCSR